MKLGDASRTEAATALEWMADMLWEPPAMGTLARYAEVEPYLAALAHAGAADGDGGAVSRALDVLGAALADPGEDLRRALAIDSTALFCGTRRDAPHPYESVFAGAGAGLMQECTVAARRAYEAAGFQWERAGANEPADHVSTELRYLAFELETSEDDPSRTDAAVKFYDEHLAGWLGEFGRRVGNVAETDAYRAIGALVAPVARCAGLLA